MYDNFDLESKKVEFGISGCTYFTMMDIFNMDVPKPNFDYEDDLPM